MVDNLRPFTAQSNVATREKAMQAFHVIDRLATKLETLGYLKSNATYDEFENFISSFDQSLERDHMAAVNTLVSGF